jgi:hypothetical protein
MLVEPEVNETQPSIEMRLKKQGDSPTAAPKCAVYSHSLIQATGSWQYFMKLRVPLLRLTTTTAPAPQPSAINPAPSTRHASEITSALNARDFFLFVEQ